MGKGREARHKALRPRWPNALPPSGRKVRVQGLGNPCQTPMPGHGTHPPSGCGYGYFFAEEVGRLAPTPRCVSDYVWEEMPSCP